MSEVSNDQIQIWLNRIEIAGKSANALGWVFLGVLPIIILALGSSQELDHSIIVSTWGLCIPVFGYFIYSGKYIMQMRGRLVGRYLLINGILGLLLLRGLIPLILMIQSFMGLSAFNSVSRTDIVVKVDEHTKIISDLEVALFAAIAVIGSIVVYLALNVIKH